MSIDGANLGIKATAAAKAIMGGEQPEDKERLTREQMLEKVLKAPDLYSDLSKEISDESYDAWCMWLARQFYLLRKSGKNGDSRAMYEFMKKKCGVADYDFTGFMVGYANNLSLWLLDLPEQANPALITFGE